MSASLAASINRITSSIVYYDNIFILAVGVPLNLINIFVFTRLMLNKKNKTNIGFLGLCQSIVDIILLMYFQLVFRSSFFGVTFTNTSDALCKSLNFIRRILTCSSSWMQLINTFGRFVYVIFGYRGRFSFMKQKRYLGLIIFGVLIVLAVANTNNLFYYLSKGTCTADNAILVASDMVLIIMRLYIPIFLMIVFNVFMIRVVIQKRKIALGENSKNRKEHHFTVAVIANDVCFFLFHLPVSTYFILYDINLYSGAFSGDPLFSANYNLFGNVVKDFSLCIQTFSFFIYLVFNKIYRREVLDILGKVIPLNRNTSVLPSSVDINMQNITLTRLNGTPSARKTILSY